MSVEYSASFGYGWIMTAEEREAANVASNYKYEDDYLVIDAYHNNGLYFLGIELAEVEDGQAYALGSDLMRPELYYQLMREFDFDKLRDMGFEVEQVEEMRNHPRFYLLSRVY